MTDADAQKIIDSVRDFSNGTNTTEADVVDLARHCKNMPITIFGPGASVAGLPNPRGDYYVGKIPGKEFDGGRPDPPKLQFSTARESSINPRVPIHSVFSVRMIPAVGLLITSRPSRNPLNKTPTLETFMFRNGQYVALDLATATPNSLVLTSRLSGCTFAIGCAGTTLYMGHAQPDTQQNPDRDPDVPFPIPFAKNGLVLGESIKKKGTAIFEGVAEDTLKSMFVIKRGEEFKVKESGITYVNHANVLGLIRDRKIYFIVTITGASQVEVEKVFLLSQASTHKWRSVQI